MASTVQRTVERISLVDYLFERVSAVMYRLSGAESADGFSLDSLFIRCRLGRSIKKLAPHDHLITKTQKREKMSFREMKVVCVRVYSRSDGRRYFF